MNFSLEFYWSLILRRLPAMTALFLACAIISTITALKLPPTFLTSAQLLVEEPQIPDSMVASTIQTDASEQLQVIERQLMTRANLIDVARKFNAVRDLNTLTPDEIVETMRAQTSIRRSGGRNQATLMTVSFEGPSGRIAANVVNEYVTLVLETNTKFRRSRAEGTLAFFEQEVERLSGDLALHSARIINFKNANASALPDDLPYRQGRQTLLQERLSQLERDRSSAINQRTAIVNIYETTGRVQPANARQNQSREEQRLADLQFQLNEALAVYSDSNPRVTMLRSQIKQLEDLILTKGSGNLTEAEAAVSNTPLDFTLAELDQRVKDMDQEIAAVNEELESLQVSIAATASNAIALDELEREYKNIQDRYNTSLNNLNQARVSERMEITSQGQRISIIESANVPQDPSGPNRIKIIAAGVAGGLGLAIGFFMLLEALNRTIRRPAELQSRFGITPLAVIPYMESAQERFRRRFVLVSAFLVVLIVVPSGLYYIDANYMPLDILASKVFSRLGLT